MLIGLQLYQFFCFAKLLRTDNLRFLSHKRHNAHGSEPCPLLYRIVIPQSADGNIPDCVDFPEKFRVHAEHPATVGKEKHFAF